MISHYAYLSSVEQWNLFRMNSHRIFHLSLSHSLTLSRVLLASNVKNCTSRLSVAECSASFEDSMYMCRVLSRLKIKTTTTASHCARSSQVLDSAKKKVSRNQWLTSLLNAKKEFISFKLSFLLFAAASELKMMFYDCDMFDCRLHIAYPSIRWIFNMTHRVASHFTFMSNLKFNLLCIFTLLSSLCWVEIAKRHKKFDVSSKRWAHSCSDLYRLWYRLDESTAPSESEKFCGSSGR